MILKSEEGNKILSDNMTFKKDFININLYKSHDVYLTKIEYLNKQNLLMITEEQQQIMNFYNN